TGISWVNDDVVAQAQLLASGLQVSFDAPLKPPPGDAAQAGVTVALEAPMPLKAFNPSADATATLNLNVPLSADLSFPNGNSILWKPAQAGAELGNLLAVLVAEQVQRVRL